MFSTFSDDKIDKIVTKNLNLCYPTLPNRRIPNLNLLIYNIYYIIVVYYVNYYYRNNVLYSLTFVWKLVPRFLISINLKKILTTILLKIYKAEMRLTELTIEILNIMFISFNCSLISELSEKVYSICDKKFILRINLKLNIMPNCKI